mmetsp:Transcript_26166/g.54617  ORF Transcript_26166/g.54617 Transcript_26166/m.54617 type:complete len:219 (+) Transcript_26166:1158-1814(+)
MIRTGGKRQSVMRVVWTRNSLHLEQKASGMRSSFAKASRQFSRVIAPDIDPLPPTPHDLCVFTTTLAGRAALIPTGLGRAAIGSNNPERSPNPNVATSTAKCQSTTMLSPSMTFARESSSLMRHPTQHRYQGHIKHLLPSREVTRSRKPYRGTGPAEIFSESVMLRVMLLEPPRSFGSSKSEFQDSSPTSCLIGVVLLLGGSIVRNRNAPLGTSGRRR